MSACSVQETGTIELYFYGELDAAVHEDVREHLARCRECAQALDELRVIRSVLAARPDVAAPASGDWGAFMQRLDAAVHRDAPAAHAVPFERPARAHTHRPLVGLLAMAALLAIVALSVFLASRAGRTTLTGDEPLSPVSVAADGEVDGGDQSIQAALTSVGAHHFERSKLVVLGLASKEPAAGDAADWAYERELATSLLNDTRLYRQAAEQRGLTSLAGVMRDLEIVLLQASMAEATDSAALPQIQRLIQKRGLVEKMDVAGTTGLLP
jgi:hypothetical protein